MNSKYPKLTRDEVRVKYREILNVENLANLLFLTINTSQYISIIVISHCSLLKSSSQISLLLYVTSIYSKFQDWISHLSCLFKS